MTEATPPNATMEAAMERFLADFDPLAALEAEYNAVLAQESRLQPQAEEQAGENEDEDDDDDDFGLDASYALLPSSPGGGNGGLFDEDGESEHGSEEEEVAVKDSTTEKTTEQSPAMDAAAKETIMTSMQQLKLAPPPWAAERLISDQELVEMVQGRLRLSTTEAQHAQDSKASDELPSSIANGA
ncbi:hypothetical protein Poli38472_012770 [Pythium oligandrum]|uniref:Uncharacterized protein n=1 Tax=Pythium oligandrum TaxID=41045 RepID=A0A8K1CEJ1_PYTOL|nr:hypothetical protein Poli38472_012770 [Pythium oligandrum]|eukprot:TMW61579.1 hypothetical protein Poli38472_012770 [Pythium oligandrum]